MRYGPLLNIKPHVAAYNFMGMFQTRCVIVSTWRRRLEIVYLTNAASLATTLDNLANFC